jgi:hypothetical protein
MVAYHGMACWHFSKILGEPRRILEKFLSSLDSKFSFYNFLKHEKNPEINF